LASKPISQRCDLRENTQRRRKQRGIIGSISLCARRAIIVKSPVVASIYQRPQDVTGGIYWINTSRPLAEKILHRNSADSPRWREYVFQRYVDIILREAIYLLGKEEPTLTPDDISRKVDDVTTKIHRQAAQDLDRFLAVGRIQRLFSYRNCGVRRILSPKRRGGRPDE